VFVVSSAFACDDTTITPPSEAPEFATSSAVSPQDASVQTGSQSAKDIAEPYISHDALAPFGVNYEDFLWNPELVTDADFEWYGPQKYTEPEADVVEYDGETVYSLVTGGSDGGDGSITPTAGVCDDLYDGCSGRCRRIRTIRARAVCWSGCMAAYAICLGANHIVEP
jgi:hypothetical protein